MASGRLQARHPHLSQVTAIDLFRQRSPAVADNGARDRLEQNAVFARYLFRGAHKDAARSIDHMRLDPHRNQADNLILEQLPVTGTFFVPDHQVHRQPF